MQKRSSNDRYEFIKFISMTLIVMMSTLSLVEGKEDFKLVHASDVIEKIAEGRDTLLYDHVLIDGNLDSYKLALNKSEKGKKIINSQILIKNSIILGDVIFHDVIFNKPISILNTTFIEDCDFSYSTFEDRADFTSSKFKSNVYLIYTRFIKDAFFLGAIFSKEANFWEAYFEEDVDFGSARFNGDVTFNFSVFRGDGYFNNAEFNKKFFLDRTKFSKLEIKFESIKEALAFSENTHLKLIENFKSLGWFNDADDCYFHYRQVNQKEKGLGWSKLIDVFGWLSCGYGVRPDYTLWLSLTLIIVFGFFYWLGNGVRLGFSNVTSKISRSNALYYSAAVFVSQPHPRWHPNGEWWKYVVLIEKIMGWMLLALFIVTLGKVMIR